MTESIPLLQDSTNKREKIAKLLSESNHSTKEIAKLVGTTEAYVWKEKSKLKTAGLLIHRDTRVISKTSQLIYTSRGLLNIPELDPEGLRILYNEFGNGRKPAEIIAQYGFHPELVENEYQRFLRLVEYDLNFLLKKFFLHFEQDLLSSNNDTLNSLHKKYGNDGNLTINEFIAMTKSLLNEKYKFGKLAAINELLTGTIPDGWQAALCLNCGKPVIGCMENVTKALRIIISGKSRPLTHTYVGMSCG